MTRVFAWIRVCFWFVVLVLVLAGKMMPAMDLMALGMLLEASCYLYQSYHRK